MFMKRYLADTSNIKSTDTAKTKIITETSKEIHLGKNYVGNKRKIPIRRNEKMH